jgi:anti-sigma factor RsiW
VTYNDAATGAREGVATVHDDTATDRAELGHAATRALLSEYLEGALEPARGERVRYHLERCRQCRAFLRTLEATISVVGRLPADRLPEGDKGRILDRLLTAMERSGSGGA